MIKFNTNFCLNWFMTDVDVMVIIAQRLRNSAGDRRCATLAELSWGSSLRNSGAVDSSNCTIKWCMCNVDHMTVIAQRSWQIRKVAH